MTHEEEQILDGDRKAQIERLAEYGSAAGGASISELEAAYKRHAIEHKRMCKIGKKLDPATALTAYWYCDYWDPYGVVPYDWRYDDQLPERECNLFAHDPNTDVNIDWVHVEDLPEATVIALNKRNDRLFKNGALEIVIDAVVDKIQNGGFWIGPTKNGGAAVHWKINDKVNSFVIPKRMLKCEPEARRWARFYIKLHLLCS